MCASKKIWSVIWTPRKTCSSLLPDSSADVGGSCAASSHGGLRFASLFLTQFHFHCRFMLRFRTVTERAVALSKRPKAPYSCCFFRAVSVCISLRMRITIITRAVAFSVSLSGAVLFAPALGVTQGGAVQRQPRKLRFPGRDCKK